MANIRSSHGCCILLLLVLSLFDFTARFSHATPTLFPNQTIIDGQSLISANKTYELGFFSPEGSNNRYVGIWYHNLPVQTVVWVANREWPLLDSSGFITFDSRGNLNILDSIGSSIVIASTTGTTSLTTATLLDSGNFVLREWTNQGNGQVLWQSFDNPTDTFLAGMKLGLDGKKNRILTSWTSPQDPSPGEFSMGLDPNGTKQFMMWRRGKAYWTSGIWDGHTLPLTSRTAVSYLHDIGYVVNWSEGYFSYQLKDSSIISRGVMDFTGQEKRLTWLEGKWVVFGAQPARAACEIPYYCGANGLCNNNTSPPCQCLFGFEPTKEEQWNLGNWVDGCKRELALKCGSGDGFFRLRNVKLPLFYLNIENSTVGLEDCKARCSSNCSCTAYASANGNGTGCLLWSGELMGLQESSDGVQDLYVRLVDSELNQGSDHRKKKRVVLVLIPVAAAMTILLLSASICYFRWRKNQVKHEEEEEGSDCSLFSFATIAKATNKFSASNKLGEGGFGPVYKAVLENQTVAVKRLSKSSGQGLEEFKNEIALISKLQHTNLVRLVGYCIQKEEKMLIYEYMPNKSLDSYIFDPIRGTQLDWAKRFRIIEGIAQGLLYLHKYSRLRIIHRDLKASNILLDSEMNPKISDFGMARIFGANENQANTRRVVGTYGYMSPEYAIRGLFSVKSDVFSFGVLLLEILSGKKNTAFQHSESSAHPLAYVWQLWEEGRGLELIYRSMGSTYSRCEVLRSIQVALLCVQDSAADRPTMSDIVSMLSSETAVLPTPKQPVFSLVRSTVKRDPLSINDVTLTSIEGR